MGSYGFAKTDLNMVGEFLQAYANEIFTLVRETRGKGQDHSRPHVGTMTRHRPSPRAARRAGATAPPALPHPLRM